MYPIEEYQKYRNIGRQLNNSILEVMTKQVPLLEAGRVLGIVKNNTFVFDSEAEMDRLMDFYLNEPWNGQTTIVKRYKEKQLCKRNEEKEILDALECANPSLYQIVSVDKKAKTVQLNDLLRSDEDFVTLTDIGFSETAT